MYVIGDMHTVNAFRICGVEGFTADVHTAPAILKKLAGNDKAAVIFITRECGAEICDEIRKLSLEQADRVIVEIPGIDDLHGLGKSLTGYITEALGVAL